jgi:hypothetical protein
MARKGLVLLVAACLPLAACEPVAIALLGAGASTALRYNMDGITARTFTASSETVRSASLAAAERMGLQLGRASTVETGEVIEASAPNRSIEIELEPITRQATRIRVTARNNGWFVDTATAAELVNQTERILDGGTATARYAPASPAASAAGGSAAGGGAALAPAAAQ